MTNPDDLTLMKQELAKLRVDGSEVIRPFRGLRKPTS
jgi:hypothetical protein